MCSFGSLCLLPSPVHSSFFPLFVSVSLLIFLSSLIFISSFIVCFIHPLSHICFMMSFLNRANLYSNTNIIILYYTLSSKCLSTQLRNTHILFLSSLIFLLFIKLDLKICHGHFLIHELQNSYNDVATLYSKLMETEE